MPVAKDALSAIKKSANRIAVETANGRFAVRNLRLKIVADDGRVVRLTTRPSVQSTPPTWTLAQGERVPAGSKMVFQSADN